MAKTLNLGSEGDRPLQRRLMSVLRTMGAELEKPEWGVGGSQEVITLRGVLNGSAILVECETYIGLTVTGDDVIVDEIAKQIRKSSEEA